MAWFYGTTGDDHIIVPDNGEYNIIQGQSGVDLVEVDPENASDNVITFWDGGDTVVGGAGSDRLGIDFLSRIENVTFHGGAGDDSVGFAGGGGGSGAGNVLDGGEGGMDEFWPRGRAAHINLETGIAHLSPNDGSGLFYEATVRNFERIFGTEGYDIIAGSGADELFRGYGGHDLLSGRGGNDELTGGEGNDTLVGGTGADLLDSGRGVDVIRFSQLADSLPGQEDTIVKFSIKDRIDLWRVDADLTTPGNQAFVFIGAAAFSGTAGELRTEAVWNGVRLSADADGDKVADFAVTVTEVAAMARDDFIL
ncbi:M10 family metallopeptidase C-terminal domain-containing protein [Inquilinus sp. Marseille-Q2685]|uniref:M10 family metallopeptidase C-terminal domain-containing protein n=1 Tax=Inquilinus sp. Marseille-Q2685 TaxID=2866581 RepID=UPI00272AD951|nr:calcium-binding protein [Inquilinus sp. Marseille-Q2685]